MPASPFMLPLSPASAAASAAGAPLLHSSADKTPVAVVKVFKRHTLKIVCATEPHLTPSSTHHPILVPEPSEDLVWERGVSFSVGPSFYRPQSSLGRDLAVLAAALYKRSNGQLRVIDAMSGCGVRALRYLSQSQADFVLANDCNPNLNGTIVQNLARHSPHSSSMENVNPNLSVGMHPYSNVEVNPNFSKASIEENRYLEIGENPYSSIAENPNFGMKYSSEAQNLISSTKQSSIGENPNLKGNLNLRIRKNPNLGREGNPDSILIGEMINDLSRDNKPELSLDGYRHLSIDASNNREVNAGSNTCAKWQVSNCEATRLLLKCQLNMDFFDLIDIDSFGSDSLFIGPALSALRYGGLLYLTCTDGFSSGGHRPQNSLASYGAFIKPMPYANELGLRMLIGAVVKEAALRKMVISPIFSVYAAHGPVFRVLLHVNKGKPSKIKNYKFIYYCGKCGNSSTIDWERLGTTSCPCSEKVSDSIKMSGPLWTGPLHNAKDIHDMIALAKEWGWLSDEDNEPLHAKRPKTKKDKLETLLNLMLEESNPELPFGYIHLDEIAKRGKIDTPRRDRFVQALQNEGYIVSRSQIDPSAIKTNCSMTCCIALAQRLVWKGVDMPP